MFVLILCVLREKLISSPLLCVELGGGWVCDKHLHSKSYSLRISHSICVSIHTTQSEPGARAIGICLLEKPPPCPVAKELTNAKSHLPENQIIKAQSINENQCP